MLKINYFAVVLSWLELQQFSNVWNFSRWVLWFQLAMEKSILPVVTSNRTEKQTFGKEYLENLLKQHFGHSEFRGKQLEAIEAVLNGFPSFTPSLTVLDKVFWDQNSFFFFLCCRKRLFLSYAYWRRKINVLSDSCISKAWNCSCGLPLDWWMLNLFYDSQASWLLSELICALFVMSTDSLQFWNSNFWPALMVSIQSFICGDTHHYLLVVNQSSFVWLWYFVHDRKIKWKC